MSLKAFAEALHWQTCLLAHDPRDDFSPVTTDQQQAETQIEPEATEADAPPQRLDRERLPSIRRRIIKRLSDLYGDEKAEALTERILDRIRRHPGSPHDLELSEKPHHHGQWDETDTLLITYGNSLNYPGEMPLRTLNRFCQDWLSDSISIVHLLPFYPASSDGGFAVIDYYAVSRELGDWSDLHRLREHFDLMFDLVVNHASSRSLWFAEYLADIPPGNAYFVEVGEKDNVSQVTRPRRTPLLFEVYTRRGYRNVWATFSHDQIDMNFRNPDVLLQFIDILLTYVDQGARIVRLDAIAYLWKTFGTTCIHLDETHEVVKLFRDILEIAAPEVLLLTETNVPHVENVSYFGAGDEAQMIYQFSLPPLILHAIHTGSTRYLHEWLSELEPPPYGCTFLNFTASHDGIGMRPLEGIVPEDERDLMLEEMRARGGYVSTKRNADGSESPYELNITYFDAFRSQENDPLQVSRFLLSQTIPMTLQGIPAFYIHSLTATPNDHVGVEQTQMTRAINRRRWDFTELMQNLKRMDHPSAQVFNAIRRRLQIRRLLKVLHPDVPQRVLDLGSDLLGVVRDDMENNGRFLVALHNVTPFGKSVPLGNVPMPSEIGTWADALTGEIIDPKATELSFRPYQAIWLVPATDCPRPDPLANPSDPPADIDA
jgi:glycosidase